EFIVGVSVGAINGAYLAIRPTPEGARDLLTLWETADEDKIFGNRITRIRELAAVLFHDSAFSNRALRAFLEQSIPARSFDETTIPLTVVASDLTSGASHHLISGDLLDAILASTAIPGLFPPVEIDGERLVDGAIADPLPLSTMIERGIRRIVVVEAGRACGCGNDLDHISGLFQRAVTIVMNDRMELLIQLAPPDIELIRLGSVCHPETPITDLSNAAIRAQAGYEQTVDVLDG
ncbi:MAG: patatin-like phospholipase family protein, partial [Longimicrobiales bacterium]